MKKISWVFFLNFMALSETEALSNKVEIFYNFCEFEKVICWDLRNPKCNFIKVLALLCMPSFHRSVSSLFNLLRLFEWRQLRVRTNLGRAFCPKITGQLYLEPHCHFVSNEISTLKCVWKGFFAMILTFLLSFYRMNIERVKISEK